MKALKISLFLSCLSGFACTKTASVKPADSQVIGRWTLVLITNGFSQKTQTNAAVRMPPLSTGGPIRIKNNN